MRPTMASSMASRVAYLPSVLALCLFGIGCSAFHPSPGLPIATPSLPSLHYSSSRSHTTSRTCLNLFDLRQRGAADSKSYRSTSGLRVAYPKLELAKLGSGRCPFPHAMDLQLAETGMPYPSRRLVIRYLEEDDLDQVVRACVKEFGSQAPSPESGSLPGQLIQSPRSPIDELKDRFEDWTLSWTVQIGLTQRIKRRRDASAAEPDHHVICLVEEGRDGDTSNGRKGETVVGIVELSQQIPDPEQTAPPFIVSYPLKKALGSMGAENRAAVSMLGTDPLPYISNVLVRPESRGKGYSRILMAAAEGLARDWIRERRRDGGDTDNRPPIVCLHVDADSRSGRAAQGLYKALGYVGVPDDRIGRRGGKFAWMQGADMLSTGLYMVQDIPLLYMTKELLLE